MGQSRPLFVYFRSFLVTISIQIEKSIDGVLGIRTRDRRMVGADDTIELRWPPHLSSYVLLCLSVHRLSIHRKPSKCSTQTWAFEPTTMGAVLFCLDELLRKKFGKQFLNCNRFYRPSSVTNYFSCKRGIGGWKQCNQIGRFFALWATFISLWQQLICPKLPALLGNFCKVVKIYNFSS